jgi:hypothetical protein
VQEQAAIGSAVQINVSGQNGRVIALNGSKATVRLSLDKDAPSVDWISVDVGELELIESVPDSAE